MVFPPHCMHDAGLRHGLPFAALSMKAQLSGPPGSCSCPALQWAAPTNSVLDTKAINRAHSNHSRCESTAITQILDQELVLGLLLFTGQIEATSLPG